MKLVKKELTTPVEIVATCWTFRFCRVMRGAVRFSVAWMTRPVTTSPWIVLDAVRVLAVIPNAWTLDMVVKPWTFKAPTILAEAMVDIFIVDAPSVTKLATAFGFSVITSPPCPKAIGLPRTSLEPGASTPREPKTSQLLKKPKLAPIEPVVIPLPPIKVDG